jgi:hypothetical protein
MAKGGSEPARVWLEGQEVPGEHRENVHCEYCESSTHRHPSRKRRGFAESPLCGDAHGGFAGASRGNGPLATAAPRPGSTLR